MNHFINRFSKGVAARSTRRTFLSTLGKLTLGIAGSLAGIGASTQVAFAAINLKCCTGTACLDYFCPAGDQIAYSWTCCGGFPKGTWSCLDCFGQDYVCNQGGCHWEQVYECTYPQYSHDGC